MSDDWHLTPMSPEQVDWLNAYRREMRVSWEIRCSGCGTPGYESCEGCPTPAPPRRPENDYVLDLNRL
jgi:hypothetical protein